MMTHGFERMWYRYREQTQDEGEVGVRVRERGTSTARVRVTNDGARGGEGKKREKREGGLLEVMLVMLRLRYVMLC